MPHRWVPACIAGLVIFAAPLAAQTTLPPISLGAGLRTSFVHDSPDGGDDTDTFALDSARIYISGPVTEKIKFMFNTEYDGASNKIGVLDAVARFEMSPKFNVWMGRFLPPSDRANLYGPYYAHHWGVYTDGIQNGHPFVFQGRDNGVDVLGRFQQGEGLGRRLRRQVRDRRPRDARPRRACRWISGTRRTATTSTALTTAPRTCSASAPPSRRRTATPRRPLISCSRSGSGTAAASSPSRASTRTTTSSAATTAGTARARAHTCSARFLFPKPVGMGKFEVLGKYAEGNLPRGRRAGGLRPGHDRVQLQLRHQGVQRAADVLRHQHGLQRSKDQTERGSASACRSRCSHVPSQQGVKHETIDRVLLMACAMIAGAGADDTGTDAGPHQGRHPALALGHDGHQRNDAEGHRADDDRRAEQERRPARPEARGGRRRSGIELAALRREGVAAARRRTKSRSSSAAGRRCRGNPCCRSSRRTTGCSSIPFSTKVRSRRRTSSTPAPRRISRRFRPSTT